MFWLLPRGAKVGSYWAAGSGRQGMMGPGRPGMILPIGAYIGCGIWAPRYDFTLVVALAAASGRPGYDLSAALDWAAASGCQGMMLPRRWNWLLSRGAKVGSDLGAGIGCCL